MYFSCAVKNVQQTASDPVPCMLMVEALKAGRLENTTISFLPALQGSLLQVPIAIYADKAEATINLDPVTTF